MTQVSSEHPSKEQLADFLEGRLAPAVQLELEQHVAQCDSCCQLMRALPEDTLLGQLRAGNTPVNIAARLDQDHVDENLAHLPPAVRTHPRYRIYKLLGQGGMGEVYLAEHRLMERVVALKVIHRTITQDPLAVERFRAEVKAAAKLAHPNIVTAHDADQAGDVHFLVMEYIEGISLAHFVAKRGPLPVAHACNYIRQAALGLQHAFEHGMVHRDIKPHNLMLTRKGVVKILDFGLAHFAHGQASASSIKRITESGAVIGTPDYIAPEQAFDSHRVDIRADIYSLGCTFYFLLTGKTPFPEGGPTQKLLAHIEDKPLPLSQFRSDIPKALEKIIDKMMAKHAGDRYQTPREVAQALAPLGKIAEPAEPTRSLEKDEPIVLAQPKPRRNLWPVLGLCLLMGATFLIVSLARHLWKEPPGDRKKAVVQQPAPVANPTAPRVLMVVANQSFWDPDYRPVRKHLEAGGATVKVASSAMTPAEPHDRRLGGAVQPDLLIQDARVADFDAVYFAGAPYSEYVGNQPHAGSARKLIKDMLAAGKHVSGLCKGVVVISDAGVLKGKPAARSRYLKIYESSPELANWDPSTPVVVTGTIVTGGDFEHGELLARTLLQQIKKAQ